MQVGLMPPEIEINMMDIECTDRRIGDVETLIHDVGEWTKRRNEGSVANLL